MLEVVGERELGFFPGLAVGSAYKGMLIFIDFSSDIPQEIGCTTV